MHPAATLSGFVWVLTYAPRFLITNLSFLFFPSQVLLQEGEWWVWVRCSVRGGVGGCHCVAHVWGQGPGQGGEDGLKATLCQPTDALPPTQPKAKSLEQETVIYKNTLDSFFWFLCLFLFLNIKLNRVNISSTRGAIEGRRANEVCRTQRRRCPSPTFSANQP